MVLAGERDAAMVVAKGHVTFPEFPVHSSWFRPESAVPAERLLDQGARVKVVTRSGTGQRVAN